MTRSQPFSNLLCTKRSGIQCTTDFKNKLQLYLTFYNPINFNSYHCLDQTFWIRTRLGINTILQHHKSRYWPTQQNKYQYIKELHGNQTWHLLFAKGFHSITLLIHTDPLSYFMSLVLRIGYSHSFKSVSLWANDFGKDSL